MSKKTTRKFNNRQRKTTNEMYRRRCLKNENLYDDLDAFSKNHLT